MISRFVCVHPGLFAVHRTEHVAENDVRRASISENIRKTSLVLDFGGLFCVLESDFDHLMWLEQ